MARLDERLGSLTLKQARRIVVFVVGVTVLVAGLAMLFLPGPGLLGVLAGLGILGTEFLWARRLLRKVRDKAGQAYESIAGTGAAAPPAAKKTHEQGE